MNRICYLSRNYKRTTSAGGKAKTDNEDTCAIWAPSTSASAALPPEQHRGLCPQPPRRRQGLLLMRRGDLVLLQYPVKKYFTFLCRGTPAGRTHRGVIHDSAPSAAKD
jgi:hypothetical protein